MYVHIIDIASDIFIYCCFQNKLDVQIYIFYYFCKKRNFGNPAEISLWEETTIRYCGKLKKGITMLLSFNNISI